MATNPFELARKQQEEVNRQMNDMGIISIEDLEQARNDQRYAIYAIPPHYSGYECSGCNDCNIPMGLTINHAQLNRISSSISSYKIAWENDKKERISSVQVRINDPSAKLSDIFVQLPYGIIKKNITGIGATTLELRSPRHSIIIVPTKALAYEKYKTGYDAAENRNNFLYVGSAIGDLPTTTEESIRNYLADNEIKYKKILVVADSIRKLFWKRKVCLNRIDTREMFFFMVDEIDIFQSDSTYRPALEKVIDYYLAYPTQYRCLVSATIRPFSNPRLKEEPVIELNYDDPWPRPVDLLIHTNNPDKVAREKIEELFKNTTGKIFIAYNKILNIRQIIENLSSECKSECSILCGERSIEYADCYYRQINNATLPSRITFTTCTNFVGIDITERFHLISISNVDYIYTLLSPEKYQQIAGRCRNRAGLLSETIIYNSSPTQKESPFTLKNYQTYLLEYADDLIKYLNEAQRLKEKYYKPSTPNESLIDDNFIDVQKDILEKSQKSYFGGAKISMVRKNEITGEFVPAYFNIDGIIEFLRLRTQLYTHGDDLIRGLEGFCAIQEGKECYKEYTESEITNNKRIENEFKGINENNLSTLIALLRERNLQETLTDSFLDGEIRRQQRQGKQFLERFKKLYKYIPFEQLITLLAQNNENKKAYRGFHNGAIFWVLADDHPFKRDLKEDFQEGITYSGTYIQEKIRSRYPYHTHRPDPTPNQCPQILGEFMKIERVNTRTNSYRIISYNKWGFTGTPINRIPANTNLVTILEFSGE